MITLLDDPVTNIKALANLVTKAPAPSQMKDYLAGLTQLEFKEEFYGPYSEVARIMAEARGFALMPSFLKLCSKWQTNLSELREAVTLTEEEKHPGNGPEILKTYNALKEAKEAGGFDEAKFGHLLDEANAVVDAALPMFEQTLRKVALMVIDPAQVPEEYEGSPEKLEMAIELFRLCPLYAETFGGEEELAKAKVMHAQSLAKQEALLARVRARTKQRDEGAVERGIMSQEDKATANAVRDASMTSEQKNARLCRMVESAEPLYMAIRRLTEITHTEPDSRVGAIDASGLYDVVQQAEALVARIEGKLN